MAQDEGVPALTRPAWILAVGLIACDRGSEPGRSVPAGAPRRAEPVASAPVRARSGRPRTPVEIRRAERFGLVEVRTGTATDWRSRRVLLEVEGSTRAYAVGDLVPGGAVLTAVERDEIRYLRDGQVFARPVGGAERLVDDLEPAPRRRVRRARVSRAVRAAVDRAVGDLASDRPERVAAALSALIGAGEGIVTRLGGHAGDDRPVAVGAVSAWGRTYRARVVGDYVIGALEAITDQSFGSPLDGGDRDGIAAAWRAWSGAE